MIMLMVKLKQQIVDILLENIGSLHTDIVICRLNQIRKLLSYSTIKRIMILIMQDLHKLDFKINVIPNGCKL